MNIIAWILLGLIAGAIAKAIYPGDQGGGILATMILGIIGAFIGGTLGVFLQTGTLQLAAAGFTIGGTVGFTHPSGCLGSVIFLAISDFALLADLRLGSSLL
jgi:uncharacterized membrane protein YeaQ/YmgE (transglycosylase-associated protein family)